MAPCLMVDMSSYWHIRSFLGLLRPISLLIPNYHSTQCHTQWNLRLCQYDCGYVRSSKREMFNLLELFLWFRALVRVVWYRVKGHVSALPRAVKTQHRTWHLCWSSSRLKQVRISCIHIYCDSDYGH